jgi:hypothetical protein
MRRAELRANIAKLPELHLKNHKPSRTAPH